MIPYTYIIGWTSQDKFYYGVQYSSKSNPSNLWKSYFTSSKYVKRFRKEYGDPDVIQIRKTFKTANEARIWESKVLRRMKVIENDRFLNKTNNIAISSDVRGNANEKYLWFTNGEINVYCDPEDVPIGYFRGRICPWKGGNAKFIKDKLLPYNDGKITKYFSITERPLTKEWKPGRLPGSRDIRINSGRHYYTDGIVYKLLLPEEVPEGWYKGKSDKVRKQMTGINNPNYKTGKHIKI